MGQETTANGKGGGNMAEGERAIGRDKEGQEPSGMGERGRG